VIEYDRSTIKAKVLITDREKYCERKVKIYQL